MHINSKSKLALKTLFVLSVVSLFTPWFTYNGSIMGYCWGYDFLWAFMIPMVILGLYLFRFIENTVLMYLSELSTLVNLLLVVLAFGLWQSVCNIKGGFNWVDGFTTATPLFWVSALVFLLLFLLFQWTFMFSDKNA